MKADKWQNRGKEEKDEKDRDKKVQKELEKWRESRRDINALRKVYRGNVSLPFEIGDNMRIAVKIVDDRGIESLKIIEVE